MINKHCLQFHTLPLFLFEQHRLIKQQQNSISNVSVNFKMTKMLELKHLGVLKQQWSCFGDISVHIEMTKMLGTQWRVRNYTHCGRLRDFKINKKVWSKNYIVQKTTTMSCGMTTYIGACVKTLEWEDKMSFCNMIGMCSQKVTKMSKAFWGKFGLSVI